VEGSETTVLGPLPKLYRVIVSVATLVVFVAVGVWAAFRLPYPQLVSVGASVGLGLGVVCAYLLVHQWHASVQPRHVRRRRHR
jgi:hypothetical protein